MHQPQPQYTQFSIFTVIGFVLQNIGKEEGA
jgi:hypothetical protein